MSVDPVSAAPAPPRSAGARGLRLAAWCVVGLAAGLAGRAAQATPTCSIDSVSSVSFGSYNVFSPSPEDTAGLVTFTCSGAAGPDVVAIELSTGLGGGYAPRRLQNGAHRLDYNLFLDASRTEVWGDGSGSTGRFSLGGLAINDTHPIWIYGRLFAGQNAHVGVYTDTLTITLQY